jgi:GAF domain/ANTAR domain
MALCVDEAVAGCDETYWADDNAAQPVLLIEEAAQVITEALHQVGSGSVLDDRDLAAAGVALGDLFGGLGQLAALLTPSVVRFAESDPREVGPREDRLQALRVMMSCAQQVAEGVAAGECRGEDGRVGRRPVRRAERRESGMSQAGSGREQLLSRAFVGLADTLVDDYDIIDLLDRLVSYSVELLAADAAGILLADSQRILRVAAFSREDANVMELLQLQADEGPCLECFSTGAPVSIPDLAAAAGRWPVFVAAVAERGAYRSVHALPLRLRGETIGTMNLFHGQPGALPDADLVLGQALADVATIGIMSERAIRHSEVVTEQLQTALNHRVIIEQAKGVLAQRGNLTMAAAFDRLRRYARTHHALLSEVARKVVETDLATDVLGVPAVHRPAVNSRPSRSRVVDRA